MTTRLGTPQPTLLARGLRQLADRLDDEGDRALKRVVIYSARGYPTATVGADGGRTADMTSSTERAALNPSPFDNLDIRLTAACQNVWVQVVFVHSLLDQVMVHASDDDHVPAGTGPCHVDTCSHVCNPRKNPDDRLRSLYCPKHHKRWCRMGKPDKGWFERHADDEVA